MQELLDAAQITVRMDLQPLSVTMNRQLADVLVSNLIRNSLSHNKTGGIITITTTGDRLTVSNEGSRALDRDKIFNRFYKSDRSEGSGLGLAIVKQTCDNYRFLLNYEFESGHHHFTIVFSPTK